MPFVAAKHSPRGVRIKNRESKGVAASSKRWDGSAENKRRHVKTTQLTSLASQVAEGTSNQIRAAGEPGVIHGFRMKHDRQAYRRSLVKGRSRERNGAMGLAARVGQGGADQRTEPGAQWSGGFGPSARERWRGSASLPGFQGVVLPRGIEIPAVSRDGVKPESFHE